MGRSRDISRVLNDAGLITTPDLSTDAQSLGQFRNRIINGDMRIWQRGTSFTAEGGAYTADRWAFLTNGSGGTTTISQSTTNLPNKSFSSKLSMALSGGSRTGVTAWGIRQLIEMSNIYDMYSGGTWTASFWYRSNRTGTHYARVDNSVGGGSAGGGQIIGSFTVSSADTWEFKTVNFTFTALTTVPTSAINTAGSLLDIGPVVGGSGPTSLSSGDYFEVTGVQLEPGSVATPFERRPYGTELALCQRYFEMWQGEGYTSVGFGGAARTNGVDVGFSFKVTKRVAPTLTYSAVGDFMITSGNFGSPNTCTSLSILTATFDSTYLQANCSGTPFTVGNNGVISSNNTSNAKLFFSSEL